MAPPSSPVFPNLKRYARRSSGARQEEEIEPSSSRAARTIQEPLTDSLTKTKDQDIINRIQMKKRVREALEDLGDDSDYEPQPKPKRMHKNAMNPLKIACKNRDEVWEKLTDSETETTEKSQHARYFQTLPSRKPSATLRPKCERKRPDMLKELQPNNRASSIIRKVSAPEGFDVTELHLTRHQTKFLEELTSGDSLQNITPRLPANQMSRQLLKNPKTTSLIPKKQVIQSTPLTTKCKALKPRMLESRKRKEASMAWLTWNKRKAAINVLLGKPRYSTKVRRPCSSAEPKDARKLEFEVVDNVHVFRATEFDIMHFECFLKTVEEIAGRKAGIVKVIMPKELYVPSNAGSGSTDQTATSHVATRLGASNASVDPFVELNITALSPRKLEQYDPNIYDVRMMGGFSMRASTILDEIRQFRVPLVECYARSGNGYQDDDDLYKEIGFAAQYGNEDYIIANYCQSSSKRLFYGVNEATDALRAAFRCDRILLNKLFSKVPGRTSTAIEKIKKPMFHVAGISGSTQGLQMTDFAAHRVNILRQGAPKCWTIIEPADHRKVEYEFHSISEKAGEREGRFKIHRGQDTPDERLTHDEMEEVKAFDGVLEEFPCDYPPRCDQFLAHQPFYLPEHFVSASGFTFRKVVQHSGEMLIIFPFAYNQNYATGNSIAEVIDFTNDRSNVFLERKIYHVCHHGCTGPRDKDDWLGYMANQPLFPTPWVYDVDVVIDDDEDDDESVSECE